MQGNAVAAQAVRIAPWLSAGAADHLLVEMCWQVFGLASAPPKGLLLSVASQVATQCLMTEFVLAYRCGAVPDFHRVPSYDTRPG